MRIVDSGPLHLTYDSYDKVGNVRTLGDSRLGMDHTLAYDALDRLETINGPSYYVEYAYDAHGNRTGGTTTYSVDPATLRLMAQSGVTYGYDDNGNQTSAAANTFTYTPDNLLASATVVGGIRTYSYDADNWRIKRHTPADNSYYLRGLQGELLAEYTIPTTGNATVRDYVYAGSRLLSAVTKNITPPASNDIYGTIVANGAAVTQAMNTAGKRLLLQFQGIEGHRYRAAAWLTAGDFGCGAWLELRTAAGDLVANAATSYGCASLLLDAVTLPESGPYYVVLDPAGSGTGTAVARLYDIHSVISPDGSLHTVTPTNGQPLLLEFEATTGQRYSTVVDVTTGSLGCVSWLELRTPQWAQVPRVQEASGCSFIMQQSSAVSVSTVHFVALDPSNTNTGTANVNLYTLVDYAGAITPNGPAVVAPLLTPGQRTALTFTGTAGQRISARSFATSGAMGCPGGIAIQRPDGTIFEDGGATCSALAFHEPVYLPTNGTYTIIVDPRYDNTPTVSVTAYLVADDVVGTLTMNGSTVPVTLTTVGQKARLTFAGSMGQQVTVRLTNNTIGQTTVKLLKPNGNLQTSRNSSSSSFNLTTVTLATTGTYTVEVDPPDTNVGGISVQVTSP